MPRLFPPTLRTLAVGGGFLLLTAVPARGAAWMEVVNLDGPGEGLNDPAPWTPVGGNEAATLGEARQRAVAAAAAIWAENLSSAVPIRLGVRFDPLGGSANEATLGLGGADDLFRDFVGAPRPGTWYPAALADRLAGLDLDGTGAVDLTVTFNSEVDGDVILGATRFYYGFDGQVPAGDIELLEVAVHEMAHGLGVAHYLDLASGAKLMGYDDAYLVHLERHGASPADFPSMSDGQRQAALGAGSEVHWTGPAAVAMAAGLTGGIGPQGHLELYAPAPPEPGSSLSHLGSAFAPDQLMEPFYVDQVELDRGLGLTVALLTDLGWGAEAVCATLTPPGPEVTLDDGDAGHTEPGGVWESRGEGFDGDARVSSDPEALSRYSFSGLSPGRQEVFVYLPGDPGAAPAARYTIGNQDQSLLTAVLDQTLTAGWVSLGVVEIVGSELTVEVAQDGRPVAVTNPSFEAVVLADNTAMTGGTTGWSNSNGGIHNPKDSQFPGSTDGDAVPSTLPHGLNAIYLNGGTIEQTLGEALAAESTYALSAHVGRRFGSPFVGYSVQLRAGATLLAQESALAPQEGEFLFSSLAFHAPAGHSAIGSTLRVRLTTPGIRAHFDLVRLSRYRSLWADGVRVEARASGTGAAQIDDGEVGYSEETGAWLASATGSGGSSRLSSSPDARATYRFTGLAAGALAVETHRPLAGPGAAAASYTVTGGGSTLGSFQLDPGSATGGWVPLGEVELAGSELEVTLEPGPAEMIPVVNPSFEAVSVADGTAIKGATPGWTGGRGIWNPQDQHYPGATDGDATPSVVPDGFNVVYSNGETFSQVVATSLEADTIYTLTVEVGHRLDQAFPGYRVQLAAGGTVLAEDISLAPAPGEFLTSSVTYAAAPSDPYLGLPLEIRLVGNGKQVNFDHVRLTARRPLMADAVRVVQP